MSPYDQSMVPAAPMIEVGIAAVGNRRRRQTSVALLDTGSDITAVPRRFADALRLYPISRLELEDVASERMLVLSYAVQLSAAGLVIPRLEIILTGLDYVVLGRDVLNRLYITLRGPELAFDMNVNLDGTKAEE